MLYARVYDFWVINAQMVLKEITSERYANLAIGAAAGGEGCANQFMQISDLLLAQAVFQAIDDFQPGVGVDKVDGAKLDGGCAGHDEFQCVLQVGDAADANHRDRPARDAAL